MAYVGKYVDRNPCLRSAGLPTTVKETAADTFDMGTAESYGAEMMKWRYNRDRDLARVRRRCPFLPIDTIKDTLTTDLKKSRFITFREKFTEEMFFNRCKLGKVLPSRTIPPGITNTSYAFGVPSDPHQPLYEIVLPNKSPKEVNREALATHDQYLFSHKHYMPMERINRHYDPKSYDPNATFGLPKGTDLTKMQVKRCLTTCDHLQLVTKLQKYYMDRGLGVLGKSVKRYELVTPDNYTFGQKKKTNAPDMRGMLEGVESTAERERFMDAFNYLVDIRQRLARHRDFHIFDIKRQVLELDTEKKGYLELTPLLEILGTYIVKIHVDQLRTMLCHFQIFVDYEKDLVDYRRFLRLLQVQFQLPRIKLKPMVPTLFPNRVTTYNDLCNDSYHNFVPDMEKVYTPPDFDPHTPPRKPRKLLGKDLVIADLMQPSIVVKLALGDDIFDEPRTKAELAMLFRNLRNINFDEAWTEAHNHHKPPNDLLSIRQLHSVLHKDEPTEDDAPAGDEYVSPFSS